jgi:hypothetical protein
MNRPFDEAAFIDGKCEAIAEACRPVVPTGDIEKLRAMVQSTEALGGRIYAMFGTKSPAADIHRSLWIVLDHELKTLEKESHG